jgi:hypothetical protein
MKHNKRRNTAFLYEVLVRQLTRASINEDQQEKNIIITALKEHFSKGKILRKELNLYKEIIGTRGLPSKQAERIMQEVKAAYSSLGTKNIFNQQTKLINYINKNLSKETYSNFVPNYKTMATISQVFSKGGKIRNKVLLESKLINYMTLKEDLQKKEALRFPVATYKLFSKKFNSHYDSLLDEQKTLLRKYIESIQDHGLSLKVFLNEELGRIKEELATARTNSNLTNDEDFMEKSSAVLEKIEKFKDQYITEDMLKQILKLQNLISEIKSDG